MSELPQLICIETRPYGPFFEMWPESNGQLTPRITTDEYVRLLGRHVNLAGMNGISNEKWMTSCTQKIGQAIHQCVRELTGKSIVIEKITPYLGTSEKVLSQATQDFPDALMFQLVRDGRDVVTSGLFHWINRNSHGTERYRYFVQRKGRGIRRFFDDAELRKWSRYWCEPILAFQKRDRESPLIRFEDMKEDCSETLRFLLRHIGAAIVEEDISNAVEAASFEKMSGGRSAGTEDQLGHIRKGITGDWINFFTKRDAEIFLEETEGCLQTMGYVENDDWVLSLPRDLLAPARKPTSNGIWQRLKAIWSS